MGVIESKQGVLPRVREALRRLSAAREVGQRLYVDLPIMYPSGALVVIEVSGGRSQYWVSDVGHGYLESEYAAAEAFYSKAAKEVADNFAVSFDGAAIFALEVPDGQLESAIVAVANASASAASLAIRRASEAKARQDNERVFDRVSAIFGSASVVKKVTLAGRHAEWEAHNVVRLPNARKAVFEFMSPQHTAAASKYLMFSDLRSRDPKLSLSVVVKDISALDEKSRIIGDVANIIGLSAEDRDFKHVAQAA